MTDVAVYVPVAPDPEPGAVAMAPREPVGSAPVVTLVENGKPRARDLLVFIAEELRGEFPDLDIDVYSKPSAGKPLEADEAKVIAARSRMVITGVGD